LLKIFNKMLFKHLIKSIRQLEQSSLLRYSSQKLFHNKTEEYLTNKLVDTNDLNFLKNIYVFEDFLTENEEISLLNEIEPYMKKLRYEFDHWDDVNYFNN
jgi:hypothetical protein